VNKAPEVDAYLAAFPPAVCARLKKMRRAIRAAAPKATEGMSYGIPAYRQRNIIVYFAGFKEHIGMFPPARGDAALEKAVAKYANAKGNLRFPHAAALPLPLISRIARHQARQDAARAAARGKR
jgi:uncharacterized protein YdhG (YjbR/CyaY superfamily)